MEEKLRTRWNVLHAAGALDGKRLQGFFSLVLLVLVDTEYRFLSIDSRSSGSSSDAQIFNKNDWTEKIEDRSLGLLAPESRGREDQIHTTSCWLMTPLP